MSILKTLENLIGLMPLELVKDGIFYIELDKKNYDSIDDEIDATYVIQEAKVPDIGKGKVLVFMGYKFIFVINKDKIGTESFYIAFKTKIL